MLFFSECRFRKKNLSHEFLSLVDGLSYLSEDQIAVEIDGLLDSLHTAHYGWDNFYNEPKHIRMISKYVPQSGDIPNSVLDKYVKTIIACRLGNYYGVSRDAVGYYDELINRFQEEHFKVLLVCFKTVILSQN